MSDEIALSPGQIGVTDWRQVSGRLTVATAGTALAVTLIVERSTRDPHETTGAQPVQIASVTGSPSAGILPIVYDEADGAWWRVRASGVAGGTVLVTFSVAPV